jgi:hypothetical protein
MPSRGRALIEEKRDRTRAQPYRQAVPALRLSLERGTEGVPDDGRFHVLRDGEVVYTSESQREALLLYRDLRDRLLPPIGKGVDVRRIIEREVAEQEANRFLADSRRAKRAKALKKGGKGGSGGVAG